MAKTQGWVERLYEYLDSMRDRPFEWARADCATFTAGAVDAMTGVYPKLPDYTDARSALEVTASKSLEDRLTELFGAPMHVGHAQRGDIVILTQGDRQILSICVGLECAALSEIGLVMMPKPVDGKAWRV